MDEASQLVESATLTPLPSGERDSARAIDPRRRAHIEDDSRA
jgi:hypothetical protein